MKKFYCATMYWGLAINKRRSTHDFDGHGKYISRSPLGVDQLMAGLLAGTMIFELFAQATHLGVDRAVVDLAIVQVRHAEQLLPRKHSLRRGEECRELAFQRFDLRSQDELLRVADSRDRLEHPSAQGRELRGEVEQRDFLPGHEH